MTAGEIVHTLLAGFPPSPEMLDPAYPACIQRLGGLQLTLAVTFLSLFFGFVGGTALAVLREGANRRTDSFPSRIGKTALAWSSLLVTEAVRGVPVMVLVLLVYYLPYPLFGLRVPGSVLAITAFTLYAAVYFSEIFRSGFRAVSETHVDAALLLGLSRTDILFTIKFPIALRAMAPDMLGLAITVFKDTSVLMVVGVADLSYTARQMYMAGPDRYLTVLFVLLLIYGSIASAASLLVHRLDIAGRKGKEGFIYHET